MPPLRTTHSTPIHLPHAPHGDVLSRRTPNQDSCARFLGAVQQRERPKARDGVVPEHLIAHGAKCLQLFAQRLAFLRREVTRIFSAHQGIASGTNRRSDLSVLLKQPALDGIELHELAGRKVEFSPRINQRRDGIPKWHLAVTSVLLLRRHERG
jgi:hypothetical protein